MEELQKKNFLTFFSIEIFLSSSSLNFKHSVSLQEKIYKKSQEITHILQEKIVKFELDQKKVLDEYSSNLEFFLVKCVHISILIN